MNGNNRMATTKDRKPAKHAPVVGPTRHLRITVAPSKLQKKQRELAWLKHQLLGATGNLRYKYDSAETVDSEIQTQFNKIQREIAVALGMVNKKLANLK